MSVHVVERQNTNLGASNLFFYFLIITGAAGVVVWKEVLVFFFS